MYRPTSRLDSRTHEKSSRSTRSTWGEHRLFATPLEADDGSRSAPYLTEDSMMDRDFQGSRGNNDLREAQRLAANFFSSQVPPSSSTSVYRDTRPTRTLSPDVPIDRFGSQSNRQCRERDATDEQRWPNNRSASQERYLSNRSVTETEFWEDVDAYGVSGSRSTKREENSGWEDVDAARKEAEYSIHGETEPSRVTKRVDWTGLFRDGSREVSAADSSMGKRSVPVYGGRQFGESYVSGQDDLVEPDEAVFSSRSRDPLDHRKGRSYVDEVPDALEEYGLGPGVGGARGVSRGGQRDTDWSREPGRPEDMDFWHGGLRASGLNELSEIPRGFGEGPATFPSTRANLPTARRGLLHPKPDYSVRGSLTNRDILGIYYGNSNHHPRKELPGRGAAPFARSERPPYGGVPGPWHGASRPPGGFNRERDDWGSTRKGKKRWPRSPKAGENPHVSHTSHGKRFKRETEADKLFLMHNSKATCAPLNGSREKTDQPHPSEKGKEKEERITPIRDDSEMKTEPEEKPAEKGLWDDSWSDSEEEKVAIAGAYQEEIGPTVDTFVGEVEKKADQSKNATVSYNLLKNALNRPVAADDEGADGEFLASEANRSTNSGNVDSTPSELANNEKGDGKSAENEDSEMFDADDAVDGTTVDSAAEAKIRGGTGVSSEKSLVFETHDTGRDRREDKAFEFYMSYFAHDDDMRRLYESNVTCGNFECLVCAGVGAKKKKRFPDVASIVQHAKKIIKTKKLPEHRGFARAVCYILGWDSTVSSPSPKTTIPRGCLAPHEQTAPTAHVNDGTKIQASSAVAADSNWDLESARRLLEEQLKEPDSKHSISETLVQTKVGTGTHASVSHEKETTVGTGDTSTTKATVNESSGLGDEEANLTVSQEKETTVETGDTSTTKATVNESSGLGDEEANLTVSQEKETTVEAGDTSTTKATVNESSGLGEEEANLTAAESFVSGVNNDIGLKSAEECIDEIPDGPEANVTGKPTPTSTDDGPDNEPLLRKRDGSAKTEQSSEEGLVGDATLVTTGFPVSQGTPEETSEHPAAEVPLDYGFAVPVLETKVEDEIQTRTSAAPPPVSKDAGTSFETQTVGESSAKYVAGETSAFVRLGTPTTLPGTGKVKTSDVSFSVLLDMQGGGSLAGDPPQAEIKPSDAGS